MIRLRVEKFSDEEMETVMNRRLGMNDAVKGLIWFEDGIPVGRVIIEQEVVSDVKDHPHYGQITSYRWAPVEVIHED